MAIYDPMAGIIKRLREDGLSDSEIADYVAEITISEGRGASRASEGDSSGSFIGGMLLGDMLL